MNWMENKVPKHQARIEKWSIVCSSRREGDYWTLAGYVYGHPKVPDGSFVRSTKLLFVDFVTSLAESKNTFYRLGKMMTGMEMVKGMLEETGIETSIDASEHEDTPES